MTGAAGAEARTAGEVTAVIVNFNGGERILRAVAALVAQGDVLHEIIVVDNHSDDGSPAAILSRFPAVRLVRLEDNRGLSVARNVGLGLARTPLVLSIDHDIYAADGCVERMVAAHHAHRAAIVCPRIRLLPERNIVQTDGATLHFLGTIGLRHAYRDVAELPCAAGFVDAAIGACLLLDRARIVAAGGFDELYFFYFEDLEFALRLRLRGEDIWCETSAEVFHERAAGTPGLSFRGQGRYPERRARLTLRNRLLTMAIHYRLRTLLVLSPVLLLYELATIVECSRRGWLPAWWQGWGWLLQNRRVIAARRSQAAVQRMRDDREVLSGGVPPLAPGLVSSVPGRVLLATFSCVVNAYWRIACRWIG